MEYPFKGSQPVGERSFWERLKTSCETRRITRREKRNVEGVDLVSVREVEPLTRDDVPLVFTTHNDARLLPFFLRHYRSLGITRFICVDDASSDATRELLLAEADTDLWTSSLRYREARRGRRWREALFRIYGLDRWYLNVDSDEFLVYDRCSEMNIRNLIRLCRDEGLKRLPAPMLDMYPSAGSALPDTGDGMPWEFSSHFDGSGYELHTDKRGISIRGGPRNRRFGEQNELIKYPLIYWDENCFFGSSPHRPLPYGRNFAPLWGVLLHFKFFIDYKDKISEAARGKQHYNDAEHYRALMSELERIGTLDFNDEVSVAFQNAQQLVDLGFMTPMPFDDAS